MKGRVRDRLGLSDEDSKTARHIDENQLNTPEEVSDPHTSTDETKNSWRETLVKYRWNALAWGLLLVFASGLLIHWGFTYFYGFIGNPLVQATVVIGSYTSAWVYIGFRWSRSKASKIDEYVQHSPEDDSPLLSYEGYLQQSPDGNLRFALIKGYRWFGLKAEPLRRRDVGYRSRPDEPVRILLDKRYVKYQPTSRGIKVSQIAKGLKPTPSAPHSEFVAERPEMAPEEHVRKQKQEIENLEEQIDGHEETIQTLRQQRDNAREEAKEAREKVLDEFTDRYTEMRESEPSRVSMSSGLESNLNQIEEGLRDE